MNASAIRNLVLAVLGILTTLGLIDPDLKAMLADLNEQLVAAWPAIIALATTISGIVGFFRAQAHAKRQANVKQVQLAAGLPPTGLVTDHDARRMIREIASEPEGATRSRATRALAALGNPGK
jgi:hypothetical protein